MDQQKTTTGYGALMRDGAFQSFLWTQFLAAFNDNVYKMIVSVGAVELAANRMLGARYLALSGAVFVLPFLLFAGYAGQIADRFSKTRVLQITKAFEIAIMGVGMVALAARSVDLLLVVLFLLAMQANFFSPAKYGILPEMLGEAQLTRANGLLELSTFAAIVMGTSVGSFLFARWKDEPLTLGGMLLGIAMVGSVTSIFIRKVPASGAREPFAWNPFKEVWSGAMRLRGDRTMWLTVVGISYFWFLGALFQMTIILMGNETMRLSDMGTGLLVTALAVGIGLGSLAAGWLSGDRIELGLVPMGAAMLGVSAILTGGAHSVAAVAVCLVGVGFSGGLFIVPLNAYLQERAGSTEKGRLLATNNFVNMIGVIAASGMLTLLHDVMHWRPAAILIALGVVTLASTVYIAWLMPAALVRFVVRSLAQFFFRIRVVGAENLPKSGGALLVSNHVSYADAILIGCATDRFIRFLMWQPLYDNRWLRPVCRLFDAIPLPTNAPKESLRALRNARVEIEAGNLVGIFPEGGLTRTAHVKPFERGVEVILRGIESTPVIPIYLDGLWGHPLSAKRGPWRLRHRVTVCIGKPVIGPVAAESLYQNVLELGSAAAEYRKDRGATLAYRFVRAARRNWAGAAIADSTGKHLSFGRALAASILMRRWIEFNCGGDANIGLLLPASAGGALANLGVTLAGKTAVNLNFTAGEEAMLHAIDRCAIRTVISSRQFLDKIKLAPLPGTVFIEDVIASMTPLAKLTAAMEARLAPARYLARAATPDDAAAIIFSSGSTGTPKGIVLSHWNLLSNIEATGQVYAIGSADCMLGVLPLFHSFGYTYTLWFPLVHGFQTVFHPNPTDAKAIGELAAAHRPTLFLSTPTFCLSYLRKCTKEQFSSIRYLLVGAEKLRPALAQAVERKFGIAPLEGYGCTEMGPVVSVNCIGAHVPESAGRMLPNVSARLVDPETFEPVAAGETGLLLVNGPSRMRGYIGEPERTAESMVDGYYVTGDLARFDSLGYLHIVDRLSRFSKIGGEMVSHLKVEEAVREILGEHACAVAGVPDDQRGERLVVLYAHPDLMPEELWRQLCASRLPRLSVPKRDDIHMVGAIPTLGTGKVDLQKVKQLALEWSTRSVAV
jgi:acyl-[acyl-carrier-protein]-phospholipid O-acyltransferase/long-chain-fatty-acid--[acyl-carrier-protein] ligase